MEREIEKNSLLIFAPFRANLGPAQKSAEVLPRQNVYDKVAFFTEKYAYQKKHVVYQKMIPPPPIPGINVV